MNTAVPSTKRTFLYLMAMISVIVLSSSCSQNDSSSDGGETKQSNVEQQPAKQPEPPKPATVKLKLPVSVKDVFVKYMNPVVEQKLPHITLEYFENTLALKDNVAAGEIPDIVMDGGGLLPVMELQLPIDLTELIAKHKFDLSRIAPEMIKSTRAYAKNGELYGLPTNRNQRVLLYNKDIFDQFAVEYPKDGMLWDDVFTLAKRLTRSANGINYLGLSLHGNGLLRSQLELHIFDGNDKANLSGPGWQKLAQYWKNVYSIPGNIYTDRNGLFATERNIAMLFNNSGWLMRGAPANLNWDYVTAPTFDNGLIPDTVQNMISITANSKNKDAAFQVVALLFSDEVQAAIGRDAALVPASSNPEVLKQYASNVKGKNVMADVTGKAATKVVEKYSSLADPIIAAAFNNIASGAQDINTALREAEEQINKKVQEEKKK